MGPISDIHHIALGVEDLARMQAFYAQRLGFTKVIAEFRDVRAPVMASVARSVELAFDGAVLEHPSGGIQLEFISRTHPPARRIRPRLDYGDIGLNAIVLVTEDIAGVQNALASGAPADRPRTSRSGDGPLDLLDPEGNLVRIETAAPGDREGMRGVILGVSDIQRSVDYYARELGFTATIPPILQREIALTSVFGPEAKGSVRSARLRSDAGNSWIELIEAISPRRSAFPFGTSWGDWGYLQTCFSCDNASRVAAQLTTQGHRLMCAPHSAGPGPADKVGEFFYALEPDGAVVEFLHLPG